MTIETKTEKIKKALATSVSILRLPGSYDIEFKEGETYVTMGVTLADLAALEPRLSLVIDALLDKRHSNLMSPDPVRNTLYYWEDPYKIKADGGKSVIKNLFGIGEYNSETQLANVGASGYELHHIGKVDYVDHTRWGLFSIHHDELEKHFPGWLQRFDVARGLGLEEEDIAAYVFQVDSAKQKIPQHALPHVTF